MSNYSLREEIKGHFSDTVAKQVLKIRKKLIKAAKKGKPWIVLYTFNDMSDRVRQWMNSVKANEKPDFRGEKESFLAEVCIALGKLDIEVEIIYGEYKYHYDEDHLVIAKVPSLVE